MPGWPVSVIQLRVGESLADNLAAAAAGVREALSTKAVLVLLPENFAGMIRGPDPILVLDAEAPHLDPALAEIVALSRANPHACIVLGGIPVRGNTPASAFNSLLALRGGELVARYDKIHLFDARLPDGSVLDESRRTRRGTQLTILEHAGARIGLSICYDLRFPEHFAALAKAGAEVLLVPSAFTVPTGEAHWEVLLRARAIENQCFVLAAAQVGQHHPERSSWGQSMIIDPWGRVLMQATRGVAGEPAVLTCELDLDEIPRVRDRMPVARHHVLTAETLVRVMPYSAGGE